MRRSPAKFIESEASNHTPSSADFTTTTPELKFSIHTMVSIMPPIASGRVSGSFYLSIHATSVLQ